MDIYYSNIYTTYSSSGKLYGIEVVFDAPPEAHEEAQRQLTWAAKNDRKNEDFSLGHLHNF